MSVNESEARLAELSRRTFLSMWSYQNPYYEQGKELCDVLVVFGNDVLVISDKVIKYAEGKTPVTAWRRWYRKAVEASVDQLQGALKTITSRPEAIYLDAKVSSPFPLTFPDPSRARYHLIAIAHGAEQACASHRGMPSLAVDSGIRGDGTLLTVGVHFDELFVHVLNRTALDALFESFDTTADLVRYLSEKRALFARDRVAMVGEEHLIAVYMRGRRPDGSSALSAQVGDAKEGVRTVDQGAWASLQADQSFIRRQAMLAPSFIVDNVIEQLASEYRQGRIQGERAGELAYHAAAFQVLATESRMARMLMAQGVVDVLNEDPRTFWSVVIESADQPEVIFVWLIYPVVDNAVSDDELEAVVGRELMDYVVVAMSKFPHARTVFGISMPNAKDTRTSRVFRMLARNVWTEKMQREAEALGRTKGILSHIETTRYVAVRAI